MHDLGDPLAASEWSQVAGHPREVEALVGGGADLHSLGTRWGVETVARPRAGARRRAGHGLPRWQQHAASPESGRCRKKGGSAAERDDREALGRSREAMAPRPA